MKLKILLASVLALVLASCGSGASEAKKKNAAADTGRVFQVLNGALTLANKPIFTPQAVVAEPIEITANCSGGGTITYTLSSTETSFTFNLKANNCKQGNTTINTGQAGFTWTYTVSSANNITTFSITFNGTITVIDPNGTDSLTYNNFSFSVRLSGNTATITLNGTVTANGESFTFTNESYTYTDLGI